MPTLEAIREARVYLARLARPGATALSELVDDVGPVAAAAYVSAGRVEKSVAEELTGRQTFTGIRDTDFGDERRGIRLVIPEDTDEWPQQLTDIPLSPDPDDYDAPARYTPLALWVRGTTPLPELVTRSVSVVGARAPINYSTHVASEIGQELARHDITTIGGGQLGIDTAAHQGALAAGGATVAVLAHGLDVTHPSDPMRLLNEITDRGAVISEVPSDSRPSLSAAVSRSRIVAALSRVLVVVHANVRSGTAEAVRTANAMGHHVLAVPGPITAAESAGTNRLIRDRDAVAIVSVADVIDTFKLG